MTTRFASASALLGIAFALPLCISRPAFGAEGAVEQVEVKAVAHFGLNRAGLDPRDRDAILADVGKLKGVTWQTVTATGHTDATGSAAVNARLSAKRAQAVKSYLVTKGLGADMIRTQAKASAQPVADNDSDAGRAQNRRAEIEFRGVRSIAN